MWQIACQTWAYDKLPLRTAIGTIARLGFRAVDIGSGTHLNLGQVGQDPEGHATRIRQMLGDFNMWVSDVYLVMTLINSPDAATRNARLRLFDRLLTFALALGAPGVTISPGIVHADGWEDSFARAIPCLNYMTDLARYRGLRISFEPHVDSIAPNPYCAQLLMDAVPHLGLTLDLAHWVAQDIRWDDMRPLFPKIAHFQFRQAASQKIQTPFEQGTIDIPQLFHELKAVDYQGVISIELMNALGWHGMMKLDIPRELSRTRDALRAARLTLEGEGS